MVDRDIVGIDCGLLGAILLYRPAKKMMTVIANGSGSGLINAMPREPVEAAALWDVIHRLSGDGFLVVVEKPVILGRQRGNSIPSLVKQLREFHWYEMLAVISNSQSIGVPPCAWRKVIFGRARLTYQEKSWKPIEGEFAKKRFPDLYFGRYRDKPLPNSDTEASGLAAAACLVEYGMKIGEKSGV
jgi:hypothetical protein